MDFLPDYGSMCVDGRYRPIFKLFASGGWKFVRKDGKPVECDTAAEAVLAAKECVKAILNPQIRAETMEAAPSIPDFLDAEAWRRDREAVLTKEQEEAFGTIFVRHRAVKVERRRARA